MSFDLEEHKKLVDEFNRDFNNRTRLYDQNMAKFNKSIQKLQDVIVDKEN